MDMHVVHSDGADWSVHVNRNNNKKCHAIDSGPPNRGPICVEIGLSIHGP